MDGAVCRLHERWIFGFNCPAMFLAVFAQCLPMGRFAAVLPAAARLLLQMLGRSRGMPGTSGKVAAAHQGPHPKPANVMDGLPLSHQPNPATERTAGKTPIDCNEMRIRPSETSFQFIS